MEYMAQPNLLLEALAFLGRGAGGSTWEHMEERIRLRKITPSPAFAEALARLKALTARLNRLPEVAEAQDIVLFRNLEGFPKNTIGSSSPAFFLFYGALEAYHGNFSELVARMKAQSPEQTAYRMALALDLADDCPGQLLSGQRFLDMVLSLSVPDSSKVAILDAFRRNGELVEKATAPLAAVLEALEGERDTLAALTGVLCRDIQSAGCAGYLAQTSHLVPTPGGQYLLRPFVFGMDTSLTSDRPDGSVCVYCGILREELLAMLSGQTPIRDNVYEAFHLLGDRTRFDILCYLRDHSAYGQELSVRFGLSRNTIHHHMNKLMACGLVRCTTDGNRVYYALDAGAIDLLLEQQRQLFLGDKPQ